MGIKAAIDWACKIAADDTHGYSQVNRWGRDYDCSSFIISALDAGGFPMKSYGATYTGNMGAALAKCGFKRVSGINLVSGAGLQAGDILLNPATHTEMYIGGGYTVGAHSSETGGKTGKTGDQTGNEISVQPYRNKNYTQVWRYFGGATQPQNINDSLDAIARRVIRGEFGNGAERVARLTAAGYNATKVQERVNRILRGG